MTPLILHTGHAIADRIAQSLEKCFQQSSRLASAVKDQDVKNCDFVIGYGILRGTGTVFKMAERLGKPWFVLDKGYFGAGHYDGYYRMGYKCTQGTYVDGDYEMPVMPEPAKLGDTVLICPPTLAVCDFFRINKDDWLKEAFRHCKRWERPYIIRDKDCDRSLDDDLARAAEVYTFNSAVGWQAFAQGIPVVSDKKHSALGRTGKVTPAQFTAWALQDQFTLADVEVGKLKEKVRCHLS